MSNIMAVLLNGIAQLEYHRDRALTEPQQLYLSKMDEQMASGIQIGDEWVQNPSLEQKSQFVAANLADAIFREDEQSCAALMAYLAVNLSDLKQVKIENQNDQMSIELVFDQDYQKQVPVQFLH